MAALLSYAFKTQAPQGANYFSGSQGWDSGHLVRKSLFGCQNSQDFRPLCRLPGKAELPLPYLPLALLASIRSSDNPIVPGQSPIYPPSEPSSTTTQKFLSSRVDSTIVCTCYIPCNSVSMASHPFCPASPIALRILAIRSSSVLPWLLQEKNCATSALNPPLPSLSTTTKYSRFSIPFVAMHRLGWDHLLLTECRGALMRAPTFLPLGKRFRLDVGKSGAQPFCCLVDFLP